jgi:hypothetical protein
VRRIAKVAKRAILVSVRVSSPARVMVYGQVGWNYRPRPHRRGGTAKGAAAKKRRLIVGLDGGEKDVFAGRRARFAVRLPGLVLRRLNRLGPNQSVRAKLTIRTTDLAGRIKHHRLRVKLRGRDRSPAAGTLPG